MFLLLRAAFRHGKRFLLLAVTFVFMLGVTLSSQMEMLALGVLTKSGPDFFALFVPDQDERNGESIDRVSLQQVEERWSEIDRNGSGVITKEDAAIYLAHKKDRNPLNIVTQWVNNHMEWMGNLATLALLLVLVAIVRGISLFGSQYTKQLVMIRVSRDLRQQYFEHIQSLSMSFYQKYNIGALSSRVMGDAQQVAVSIYASLTNYVQTPIAVISSLIICFYVSVELSLIVFFAFPILLFPLFFFSRRVKRISRNLQKNNEHFSSILIDFIAGIQTIKIFAMERFSLRKFKEQNERMAVLEEKSARYGFSSRPVLHMMSTLVLAGLIMYGLYVAQLSISEILIFCGMVYVMYEPMKKFNDENLQIQRGIVAAERMFEVLDMKPVIQDQEGAIEMSGFQDSIEFDNVSFRYEGDWILRNVSFKIQKGQIVALVGPTGAGKSTIAQLLPRLYECQEGEIRIDGQPLKMYTQRSLRENIAFVPQRPFLFLDTVAQNIGFGRNYKREEIEEAARRAHADEFIQRLPQKYDSPLAEMGKNLSGGQQQRLAIARALVKQAPILVMDEATSALDAVSENRIKLAIRELRGSVTQILIAHRFSTIEDADKIIYLERGQKVAEGTKDELLQICPNFRHMWELMHSSVDIHSPEFVAALS
jgi:ABC-type multidrug transport system fused ATPase/permease subunit